MSAGRIPVGGTHQILIRCPKCGSDVGFPSAKFTGTVPIHPVPPRMGAPDTIGVLAEFPGGQMRTISIEVRKQCRLSGAWVKIDE
jgi:hypothetical protein